MEESYHSSQNPVPIVVDAHHAEEGQFSNGYNPDSQYSPSAGAGRSLGVRDYAATDVSESDYFPRRGRSPPTIPRHDIVASDIPLPESSTGSNYLESTTRDTSAEYESGGAKLTMPSTDEHNQGPQYTEQEIMEANSMSEAEEPRNTAAALESSTAYPGELAGVGQHLPAEQMTFSIGKANLDDDLMTDTHNDRIVLDNHTLLDTSTGG